MAGRASSRASPLPQWDWLRSVGNWSAVRPPSRAGSLLQWGWVQAVGDWSAVRPPSLASQLPQWDWGGLLESGRLEGRHREQAHSYSGVGCRQLESGRLSGRHRWQASSHSGIGGFCWRVVGSKAAIASRFTPTEKQSSPDKPHAFHHSNGRVSARRKLLILPCRPLRQAEWRGLSGGGSAATVWRSQTHREEVQRSKPEAMPPDEHRNEGTRA